MQAFFLSFGLAACGVCAVLFAVNGMLSLADARRRSGYTYRGQAADQARYAISGVLYLAFAVACVIAGAALAATLGGSLSQPRYSDRPTSEYTRAAFVCFDRAGHITTSDDFAECRAVYTKQS